MNTNTTFFENHFVVTENPSVIKEYSILSYTVRVTPEELRAARETGELDCDAEYIDCYEFALMSNKDSFEAALDMAWEGMMIIAEYNGWVRLYTIRDFFEDYLERDEDSAAKAFDAMFPYSAGEADFDGSADDFMDEFDMLYRKAERGEFDEEPEEDEYYSDYNSYSKDDEEDD